MNELNKEFLIQIPELDAIKLFNSLYDLFAS